MRCPQCGGSIPDNSRFCTNCGHPIDTVKHNPETSKSRSEGNSGWKNRIVLIAILLIIAAGVILIAIRLGADSRDAEESSSPDPVLQATAPAEETPTPQTLENLATDIHDTLLNGGDDEASGESEGHQSLNPALDETTWTLNIPFAPESQMTDVYDPMLDRDGNNVLDCVENNDRETDTDGDGLTDFQELVLTGTNPVQADSDGNGKNDYEKDPDGDGLSTGYELGKGSSPRVIDSDNDGLTDAEEIDITGTDPRNADTDSDGAPDGWEYQNGFNPIADEKTFAVTVTAKGKYVTASAGISASGETASSLSIRQVRKDPRINSTIPGYIDSAFEIRAKGDPGIITITFELGSAMQADGQFLPAVYCLNEETDTWYELETSIDGNRIIAQATGYSKYILLNKSAYDGFLETIQPIDPAWISSADSNRDGISDHITELMCKGIIRTKTGTKVFGDYSYEEVQANADLDGDGIPNGKEVLISVPENMIPNDATELNGHYYKVFDQGETWGAADSFCISMGGHLATITSADEQELIKSLVFAGGRNSYWLGARGHDRNFSWITGEEWTCDYGHYNNVDKSGYEDSLMMYRLNNPMARTERAGMWNDLHHDGVCGNEPFFGIDHFGLVCEWEAQKTDYVIYLESSPCEVDTDSDGFEDPVDPTPHEADVFRTMQDYKKYYFGDDTYTVTICIKQPVWNSRQCYSFDAPLAAPYISFGGTGHTFLAWDGPDGQNSCFGFAGIPFINRNLALLGVNFPGTINKEIPIFTIAKSFEISKAQMERLLVYCDENANRKYNLTAYNCTTFAVELLNEIGVHSYIREHPWHLVDYSSLILANINDPSLTDEAIGQIKQINQNIPSYYYGYSPADAVEDIREHFNDYVACRYYQLKDGTEEWGYEVLFNN